ncbi:MAG: hypothetical protein PGN25_05770 [Methylorubrum populi]
MADPHLVDVDANGVDAEGNDYRYRVQPHVLAAGLMVEQPVMLRFPDGRIASGMRPMFTEKGIAYARDGLAAERAGHKPGQA